MHFRFIIEHIETTRSAQSQPSAQLGDVNEWILHEATAAFEQVSKLF